MIGLWRLNTTKGNDTMTKRLHVNIRLVILFGVMTLQYAEGPLQSLPAHGEDRSKSGTAAAALTTPSSLYS